MTKLNPLDHPICFSKPQRIAASTWTTHVPFAMYLVDLVKPDLIVELGTYLGVSYCAFCQAIRELGLNSKAYAIDTWRGDPQSGYFGDDVLHDLRQHHDPLYSNFSNLIQSSFDDSVHEFQDGTIRLLHIDGCHTYNAVKHDFSSWLPKVHPDGIIMFHDINVRERDFGVWRLWEQIKQEYPTFEFFHGHGLGIMAVSASGGHHYPALFNLGREEAQAVRDFFHTMGDSRERFYEQELAEKRFQTQLADKEKKIEELHEHLRLKNEKISKATQELAQTEQLKESEYESLVENYNEQTQAKEQIVHENLAELERREKQIHELKNRIDRTVLERDNQIKIMWDELAAIKSSSAWRLLQPLRRFRATLMPGGSRAETIWLRVIRWIANLVTPKNGVDAKKLDQSKTFERKPADSMHESYIEDHNQASSIVHDIPDISVIIPVFNAIEYTKQCLESIFNAASDVSLEVLVVDNGSTDKTPVWLKSTQEAHPEIKILRLNRNHGFAQAINHGIRHSRGENVIILNNDTIVTNNWLDKLLDVLHEDPSIGIVSPVTNYVGEGLQIDPDAINLTPDGLDEYAQSISDRNEILYEANRLVFFCVLIRRQVVDVLGDLDIKFDQGNYEDDDYCVRARLLGYRLAIARNTIIYHFGSATFLENDIRHEGLMVKNFERFYRKLGRIATTARSIPIIFSSESKPVSVIVRTRDRPQSLFHALNSLENQTYRNFEVVIVNDGGEDITDDLQRYDSSLDIQYIFEPDSVGRSEALNIGISGSKGTWVAYLDDDDIFYPWHLETFLLATNRREGLNALYYSNYNKALFNRHIDSVPISIHWIPPWEYNQTELFIKNYIPIIARFHTKKSWKDVNGYKTGLDRFEDYEILLRLQSVIPFVHIGKVTVEYRFYLDGSNTMVSDSCLSAHTLEGIFQMHPVEDSGTQKAREKILGELKEQELLLEKIQKEIATTPEQAAKLQRETLRIIAGI